MSYATFLITTKKRKKIMRDFKETMSQHFDYADEFELDTIIDLENENENFKHDTGGFRISNYEAQQARIR
jgi:hypothetical protein